MFSMNRSQSPVGHELDESDEQLDAHSEQSENGEGKKWKFDDFDKQFNAEDEQKDRNKSEERHSVGFLATSPWTHRILTVYDTKPDKTTESIHRFVIWVMFCLQPNLQFCVSSLSFLAA